MANPFSLVKLLSEVYLTDHFMQQVERRLNLPYTTQTNNPNTAEPNPIPDGLKRMILKRVGMIDEITFRLNPGVDLGLRVYTGNNFYQYKELDANKKLVGMGGTDFWVVMGRYDTNDVAARTFMVRGKVGKVIPPSSCPYWIDLKDLQAHLASKPPGGAQRIFDMRDLLKVAHKS